MNYDALLLVSFGGPERREDVIPFLENVLRGRNVPRERMLAVAEHYYHFGGRTPINDQNHSLIAALKDEFAASNLRLPVYWGNRNWHPLLPDTFARMAADGVRNTKRSTRSTASSAVLRSGSFIESTLLLSVLVSCDSLLAWAPTTTSPLPLGAIPPSAPSAPGWPDASSNW